jgi:hypothetical protein
MTTTLAYAKAALRRSQGTKNEVLHAGGYRVKADLSL